MNTLITIESELVTYGTVLAYGGAVVLSILAARLIFSVPTITKRLKINNKLLEEIAKKQGVDAETINKICNEENN